MRGQLPVSGDCPRSAQDSVLRTVCSGLPAHSERTIPPSTAMTLPVM